MHAAGWHLYVLRCGDGSLYAGIATDVERRLTEHRNQGARCAKYLRGRLPLEVAFTIPAADRAQASRWENLLKRLSKADKEALVTGRKQFGDLLEL